MANFRKVKSSELALYGRNAFSEKKLPIENKKLNWAKVDKIIWKIVGTIIVLIVLSMYSIIAHALFTLWFLGGK